jgi:hypothetical protein
MMYRLNLYFSNPRSYFAPTVSTFFFRADNYDQAEMIAADYARNHKSDAGWSLYVHGNC